MMDQCDYNVNFRKFIKTGKERKNERSGTMWGHAAKRTAVL